ncbi:hypothetical protein [Lichenicoccus sp.]|uniref:hypothetical protein n=1 Tax=Lichenicoccus sp. TaxID=2781899 RepID=UPI003D0E3854
MSRYPFSSATSGVLYAEDFGEPLVPQPHKTAPAAAKVDSKAVLPSFSLDELRAAAERARAEGRDAERLASAQLQAAQRSAALAGIAEGVHAAHSQAGRLVEHGLDAIACTTLAMLSAALPALCVSRAETDLRNLLRHILPPARHLPELHIRLNPSLRPALEEEATSLLEGSAVRVIWTEVDKMMPGDVAVSWQNGSALREINATCASIRDAVMTLLDDRPKSLEMEAPDVQ